LKYAPETKLLSCPDLCCGVGLPAVFISSIEEKKKTIWHLPDRGKDYQVEDI
jgi:hypothetical protein